MNNKEIVREVFAGITETKTSVVKYRVWIKVDGKWNLHKTYSNMFDAVEARMNLIY